MKYLILIFFIIASCVMNDRRIEKKEAQIGVLTAYMAKAQQCRQNPEYIFFVSGPVEKTMYERCISLMTSMECPMSESKYPVFCRFAAPIKVGGYNIGIFDKKTYENN